MSIDRELRTSDFASLPANAARVVDEICDCFEHQLYTGGGPRIEELLTGFQEPDRSVLLRELLLLEMEQTVARGDQPDRQKYFQRFPDQVVVVREAIRTILPDPVAPSEAEDDALPIIPHYRVLRKINAGGMGAVYEAMHTKLGNLVAIKVLRPNLAHDLGAEVKFEREMKIIGTLTCPHIVLARDAGKADGTHYLVMEYLVGCDLAGLVSRSGPLPVADACEIARRVALALRYAHQRNLVHRDIKPMNVLIGRSSGADGPVQVKVADFGLALLRGYPQPRDSASSGKIVGTFVFMAPEQFWEQRSDIRSDIYSLGCTLYYLLRGSPPFTPANYPTTSELMRAHKNEDVPSLQASRTDVDDSLQSIVSRMLAKDPSQRQQSPESVADQLAAFTTGHDLNRLIDRLDRRDVDVSAVTETLPNTESIGANAVYQETLPSAESISQSADLLTSELESCPTVDPGRDETATLSPQTAPVKTLLPQGPKQGGPDDSRGHQESPVRGDRFVAQSQTPARRRSRRRWMAAAVIVAATLASLPWASRFFASSPVDLLASVDVQRDSLTGDWTRKDGVLVSPDQPQSRIALRHDVPQFYRLEVVASRKTGGRLVIGLVHGGRQLPIVLDATVVDSMPNRRGNDKLDSKDRAAELGFSGGSPDTYTCIVHPSGVLVAFENQIRFIAGLPEVQSEADLAWCTSEYDGLFIGTHNSIYEISEIALATIQP